MVQQFREHPHCSQNCKSGPLCPDYLYQDVVYAQTCFPLIWSLVRAWQRVPVTSRHKPWVLGPWGASLDDNMSHTL